MGKIALNIDIKSFIIGLLLGCVFFLSLWLFNSGIGRYQIGENQFQIIDTKTGIVKFIHPKEIHEIHYVTEKYIARERSEK